MIVTDARLAKRGVLWSGTHAHGPGALRKSHQRFKNLSHIRVGKPEIAMPPLFFRFEQLGVGEF
ncbi:hypothetical protein D3C87_1765220 [compost metagenome]